MTDRTLQAALTAVGLDPLTPTTRLKGFSGATVVGLRVDGRRAVLKATPRNEADGPQRELRCYQELAQIVPVRTPEVVAAVSTADLDVLLLGWVPPAPPARDWPADRWTEVARQLGTLHASLDVDGLAARPWLRDHAEPVAAEVLAQRKGLWAELPPSDVAARLFDRLPGCRSALRALPTCLVHGDCHAENLLIDDDGDLVWIDWQDVGRGSGPEELALWWQRAEFNGAEVPRTPTLATYARARGVPDDATLRRAVLAAEIALLLLGWPEFLLRDPDQPRDLLFERLRDLERSWS